MSVESYKELHEEMDSQILMVVCQGGRHLKSFSYFLNVFPYIFFCVILDFPNECILFNLKKE